MNDPTGKYRTFLAVADAGSVSEAARRLVVSQPAVSAEIAALEGMLGVRLFVRSRRGVRLTEAGEIIRGHHFKEFFQALAAMEAMAADLNRSRVYTIDQLYTPLIQRACDAAHPKHTRYGRIIDTANKLNTLGSATVVTKNASNLAISVNDTFDRSIGGIFAI